MSNLSKKSNKIRKTRLVQVREPSGRPSRAQDDHGRNYGPTEVRRLRDAALRGLRDAEWGTELGALFLEKKITGEMYGAGKWWADTAALYHSALDAPSPSPKALSVERGAQGSQPDTDSDEGRRRAAKDRQAVKDFREAHAVLRGGGLLAEWHVRALCEENIRPLGALEMEVTIRGLAWLAQWRIDKQEKSSHNGR
jgi:hypothetical protein